MATYQPTLILASVVARAAAAILVAFVPTDGVLHATTVWNDWSRSLTIPLDSMQPPFYLSPHVLKNPFLWAESVMKLSLQTALMTNRWAPTPLLLYGTIAACVIAPLFEELAYRGGAQWLALRAAQRVAPMNRTADAALASRATGAFFFGTAHIKAAGAAGGGALELALSAQKAVGTFASSLLIESRLAHARKSVWAAVGAHAAFNLIANLPTSKVLHILSISSFVGTQQACASVLANGASRADSVLAATGTQLTMLLVATQVVWRVHRLLLRRITEALEQRFGGASEGSIEVEEETGDSQ